MDLKEKQIWLPAKINNHQHRFENLSNHMKKILQEIDIPVKTQKGKRLCHN
jgi:hypothetical protein